MLYLFLYKYLPNQVRLINQTICTYKLIHLLFYRYDGYALEIIAIL